MLTKNILVVIILSVITYAARAQAGSFNVTNNDLKNFSSFYVQLQPDAKNTAFNLFITNPEKKKLQITIRHSSFGLAIDTTISGEEYQRRYNFNEADDGKYIITVANGKEKITREIEINTVTSRNLVVH